MSRNKYRIDISRLLTSESAKEIDIIARDSLGISTLVLMENAGRAVAEEVAVFCGNTRRNMMRRYPAFCGNTRSKMRLRCAIFCGNTRSKMMLRCAIFCGKGNNGGDGFVAARHMLTYGLRPDIFLAGRIKDVENEARINLEIILNLKQKIAEVEEENLVLVKNKILKYNLIIDALLGVGLQGMVRGIYRDLIGIINTAKAPILSVDIPSGLDATTGKVLGCCVKADKTVTFVAKKRGMVVGEGPKFCGRIVVRGLGLPL